jgi:hypothetical protein
VPLGHRGRRHAQQNAAGVHQTDLLALAGKGYGLALYDVHANLVREDTHHRSALNPGNLFQLFAPLAKWNKEDISSNIFAEDGKHLRAAHLAQASGLDVAGPGDAKTGVARQVRLEHECDCDEAGENNQSTNAEKDPPNGTLGTPPGVLLRPKAPPTQGVCVVAIRVRHFQRHTGQVASRRGHTLPHTPKLGLRRRFILPVKGAVRVIFLSSHA